jgi:pimeloyl-ACP methyl ester carboxylesterase
MPAVSQMDFSVEPRETGSLSVAGCELAYATWGLPDRQPVVLVHGAGAQLGWWDAVVGELSDRHRIIAFDLSGNGDSGWRPEYTGELWATEVAAVAEHLGGGEAVLVGHSLGGRVSIIAAARHPELFARMVLVDVPLRHPDRPRQRSRTPAGAQHESLDAALQSFHLLPNEPVLNRELLMRVAANSFTSARGHWILKADPQIYGRIADAQLLECLREIEMPITLLYGERSAVLDDEGRSLLIDNHRGATALIAVQDGFHHLTFDHAERVAEVIVEAMA